MTGLASAVRRTPAFAAIARRISVLVSIALLTLTGPLVVAQVCAVPGADGPTVLPGGVVIVNTYFPAVANAAAGSNTIQLGTARGAATAIAPATPAATASAAANSAVRAG